MYDIGIRLPSAVIARKECTTQRFNDWRWHWQSHLRDTQFLNPPQVKVSQSHTKRYLLRIQNQFTNLFSPTCFSAVLGDDGLTEDRTSTHRCCKIYQNIKYYQNRKRKIWEKRWAAEVIVMLWKRREMYCFAQHGKRLLWLRASMFTLRVLMDKLSTLLSLCSQTNIRSLLPSWICCLLDL